MVPHMGPDVAHEMWEVLCNPILRKFLCGSRWNCLICRMRRMESGSAAVPAPHREGSLTVRLDQNNNFLQ